MTYEIVRAYCGWPSRDALKNGVPALDAFPAGWRTLVIRRGRKWTTILDPFSLQKERVKNDKLDAVRFEAASISQQELRDIVTKRLAQLQKPKDEFLTRLLNSGGGHKIP